MHTDKDPGLYRDIERFVFMDEDKKNLLESIKERKEQWIEAFIARSGIWAVRDLIEDMALKLRVCEEKLEASEEKYALARIAIDLLKEECSN